MTKISGVWLKFPGYDYNFRGMTKISGVWLKFPGYDKNFRGMTKNHQCWFWTFNWWFNPQSIESIINIYIYILLLLLFRLFTTEILYLVLYNFLWVWCLCALVITAFYPGSYPRSDTLVYILVSYIWHSCSANFVSSYRRALFIYKKNPLHI